MKKIVSLCLTMVMLLSLFCVPSLGAADDTRKTEAFMKHCEVLKGLHIINAREKGTYTNETELNDRKFGEYGVFRNISKSSFINYVCNFYQDYGFSEDYSPEAIQIAEELGIIHKNQNDLTKYLYFDEAVTILVRLLGFEYHAQLAGGFPTGYITIANRLGLTEGIASGSGMRMQEFDAINLLYNAINAAYVDIISISDEGIQYGNVADTTFLYEFRKIYRINGILQGTASSAVTTAHTVSDGYAMINGYLYEAEKDFTKYLGMQVEAYVHAPKNDGNKILFMIPDGSEEIIVPVDDIKSLSEDITKLTYYDQKNQEKTVSISPVVNVLYNGQPVDDYTKDDFVTADGTIRLVNNDTDYEYDVIFIEDFQTVVVDGISVVNETVRDFYTGETIDFHAELDEIVKIIGAEGELELSALKMGDVLRVAESAIGSKRMLVAYLSDAQIQGTVTEIQNRERVLVSVDNAVYELSKVYQEEIQKTTPKVKKPQVGMKYLFYLDRDGKIAYGKETDGALEYGLVFAKASEGNFQKQHMVRIFTTNGMWKDLQLAEKLELNDSTGTQHRGMKADDAIQLIPTATGNDVISLIGYTTDAHGIINRIDIPVTYTEENGKDGRLNVLQYTQKKYRPANTSFVSDLFLSDTPTIWLVDVANKDKEDAYSVSAKSFFENGSEYTFSAYQIDEFYLGELFVVETDDITTDRFIAGGTLVMVDEMQESMDSEGNQIQLLMGAMGNYESISFTLSDDVTIEDKDGTVISQLAKGDIVSMDTDSSGKVKKVKRYTSLVQRTETSNPANADAAGQIIQGKVHAIDTTKNLIRIDCGENGFRTIRTNSISGVTFYDLKRDRIFKGSLSDIELGSILVTKLHWHAANSFMVFQ